MPTCYRYAAPLASLFFSITADRAQARLLPVFRTVYGRLTAAGSERGRRLRWTIWGTLLVIRNRRP